jgi:very-short-patch-repair endonuclease
MPRNIVIGQPVKPAKILRARELRSDQTAAEAALWQALRANRLDGAHFRRQQVIKGFIVDFYCHRAGLVIEVDGAIHQQQADQDAKREQVLQANGLHILRFSNQQVMAELPAVLQAIHGALAASDEGNG